MNMDKREIMKRIVLLGFIVVLIVFGCFAYKELFSFKTMDDEGEMEISKIFEFDVNKSNYIEDYYERYKAYKELHSEYTDDQIITYVNIGLAILIEEVLYS